MYSDFEIVKTDGEPPHKWLLASVIETTGWLFWRTQRRRYLYRPEGVLYWRFVDTGEFSDGRLIENLEAAYEARQRFGL